LIDKTILYGLNLRDFIEIYRNNNIKNKQIYKYFKELEKKLPIFYDFISNIKLSYCSDSYCSFPRYYNLVNDFERITIEEISRIKFNV
jgi:hypothetical protein